MLPGRSKSKHSEVAAGDGEPVTLLSMASRRAPTPAAYWGMRVEVQPEEKVTTYNRQKSASEHLTMNDDQVYSGLLRFTYCPNGSNTTKSHDLHVTSQMTCGDVVPILRRHLVPHLNGMADPSVDTLGHISLVQGEMERVLDNSDKPLEIALECSTKRLASPKFVFQPPVDPLLSDGSDSHRMRTSGFTSYVGALTAHSNPNLAVTPSAAEQSPNLPTPLNHHRWISTDGELASLYSADSCNSLSSGGRRLHHMSKSVSALEEKPKLSPQRNKLLHMRSADHSEQNTSPTSSTQLLKLPTVGLNSPSSHDRMRRAKNSVGNLFTRSLRGHKKLKSRGKASKSSLYNTSESGSHGNLCMSHMTPEEREASAKLSHFASPRHSERRLTMSAVMHIYYRDASEALIYKSLLVSQRTKARVVVMEALKRFDLTVVDPKDFSLHEVVGRWQDVSQSVANDSPGATLELSLLSAPRPAVTAIEEFVVCYSRAIGPNECPYNLQFYFAMHEGYTRRFELRQQERSMHSRNISRSYAALDVKENERYVDSTPKRLSWANTELLCRESSPLFGDTSHRKKRSKKHNSTSAPLSKAVLEGSETEEDILDEVKPRGKVVARRDDIVSKVKLRNGRVKVESLLTEEVDSEVATPHRRQVLLSATSSSPDSGVVSFSKDKKPRHNSADFSSTADQHSNGHQLESVSLHASTPTHGTTYPPLPKTAFLLSLRLHHSEEEHLIQPLGEVTTHIMAGSIGLKLDGPEESGSIQHVCLHHTDLPPHPQPLCSLQLQITHSDSSYTLVPAQVGKVYTLHPTHPAFSVHLNGNLVVEPMPLSHGDLLSVFNDNYLFLYQDYSSVSLHPSPQYNWRPHPLNHSILSSPFLLNTPPPSSPILKEMQPPRKDKQFETIVDTTSSQMQQTLATSAHLSPLRHSVSYDYEAHTHQDIPLSQSSSLATELPGLCNDAVCQTPTLILEKKRIIQNEDFLGSDERTRPVSADSLHHTTGSVTPIQVVGFSSLQRPRRSHRQYHLSSSNSSTSSVTSSTSRKSLFSFNLSEEAHLLRYLVTDLDVSRMSCYLGPALLLAMCTEYSHKCHGPAATSKFLQKMVDSLQEVVWECTKKLTQWKPDPAMVSRPLSHCEGLFPLLKPTVFWLANGLELHHLLCHSCTPLSNQSTQQGENPVTTLHNILVYAFQQMFYTVSKVLFYSLPLVLDGCKRQGGGEKGRSGEGRRGAGEEGRGEGVEDEIVEQAVDFLQALLDLMTDLHLHLEVVSCFYANLFFFINTTLLNSVMQLGPQRGVFTHAAGTTLRSSLTLLEGWACQVGFKDAVLHHLAKLSSILDILAMSPHQLVELSWDELRDEFPVLHPAQLHLLLSHYTPPPSLLPPSHWAPTLKDLSAAHDSALVSESYDCHPGLTLPQDSYTLQLNKTPPQYAEFQALVEDLHSTLRCNSKSVDMVPVVESAASAQVPTLLTDITTPPTSHHHQRHRSTNHVNGVGQDTAGGRRQDVASVEEGLLDVWSTRTEPVLVHSCSHDSLLRNDHVNLSGIGSNTESQEDLLETHDQNHCNRHHNKTTMGEKSNSGSKVADLINTYEETAKLSQSSSDSVKSFKVEEVRRDVEVVGKGRGDVEIVGRGRVGRGDVGVVEKGRGDVEIVGRGRVGRGDVGVVEKGRGDAEIVGRGRVGRGDVGVVGRGRGDVEVAEVERDVEVVGRGRVGRVMSMVMEHRYSQPQTLILREVGGCAESVLEEEWMSSLFPDGAHLVNIQRGDKGFGVVLVEQKDPSTGTAAIYVQHIQPGSPADQCQDLKAGDRVLAIDGQSLDGAEYLIADRYLKEAEDDVQLVLAPRPLIIQSQ